MTPTDVRDLTWADLQKALSGLRERVYWGYRQHGPCTTEQLAQRMQMSILTVRPRTTELVQLGMVLLTSREGHDGIYYAIPLDKVEREALDREARKRAGEQLTLRLTA